MHPGVTVDEVVEATGFELVVAGDVPETRAPTDEELRLIREVLDPHGLRDQEVPERDARSACTRASAELFGVDVPDRADRHGLGRRARASSSATADAGGLGILAAATMTYDELRARDRARSRRAPTQPFGVNLRADAADVGERVDLLIDEGVKVASFALAPEQELIAAAQGRRRRRRCPSIGAARHAEKVAAWGVDAVIVQGGEGGGHTGAVPTTLLLPAGGRRGRHPGASRAGGFFDGRGLVAALAYGAGGIAMGTRFLLTADSPVPDAVKQRLPRRRRSPAPSSPRRSTACRTGCCAPTLVERARATPARVAGCPRRVAQRAARSSKLTGMSLARHGRARACAMRKRRTSPGPGRSWPRTRRCCSRPALVDGELDVGVLATGQVVGVIDDLPTCAELIDRIIAEADAVLDDLTSRAGGV